MVSRVDLQVEFPGQHMGCVVHCEWAKSSGGHNSDSYLYLCPGQVKITVSVYLPWEMEPLKA